jgi:predicted transcriptional regulator
MQEMCQEAGLNEVELLRGGRRRRVSEARANIAYHLSTEMGLSLAEIARRLGVGTSGVAMAIRKKEGTAHK